MISGCVDCPRKCKALRENKNSVGFCSVPKQVTVARAALHYWEEPCISGEEGSGAVFFSGCNLKCVYCQNREIAAGKVGWEISEARLAEIFLELAAQGANNINLVTPSHYYPQIKRALSSVKEQLKLPIIANTSSYDSVETLQTMEGWIDIYLADYKYHSSELAARYSKAADYPQVAQKALKEMLRQVGEPEFDVKDRMTKGMIIRHLQLPGHLKESKETIRYLYETFGNSVYLSIMNQYTPFDIPNEYKELDRNVSEEEYEELVDYAIELGVENGFIQEGETAEESFIPEFDGKGILK